MPQMGPLMWFLMMSVMISTLMTMSTINYFSYKTASSTINKPSTSEMNWKW